MELKVQGTSLRVRKQRVVDGDTIRVYLPGSSKAESLRILSLDTEESFKFSSKPVTPWGKAAKAYAVQFFKDQNEVVIEFPGTESVEECLDKYRGTFGRLLVWVHRLDGVEFTERMIRLGYSPYFNKYGNAEFESHHRRYTLAERAAQMEERGVWDQETVNGRVIRNYAALGTWWNLRATIIDRYRVARKSGAAVYNTRKDFAKLKKLADEGATATVFTEIRDLRRVKGEEDGVGVIASIGSDDLPFEIRIPDIESQNGAKALELIRTRYKSSARSPNRGYCYVKGKLSAVGDKLQMVVESPTNIFDELWMADEAYNSLPEEVVDLETTIGAADGRAVEGDKGKYSSEAGLVRIVSLLPNPVGRDRGNETATLVATGDQVDVTGWSIVDKNGGRFFLDGSVDSTERVIILGGKVKLLNTGSTVKLEDAKGALVHEVSYSRENVREGQEVRFPRKRKAQ